MFVFFFWIIRYVGGGLAGKPKWCILSPTRVLGSVFMLAYCYFSLSIKPFRGNNRHQLWKLNWATGHHCRPFSYSHMLSVNEMVWSSTSQGKLGSHVPWMQQSTSWERKPSTILLHSQSFHPGHSQMYIYSIHTKNVHNISHFVNSVTIISGYTDEPEKSWIQPDTWNNLAIHTGKRSSRVSDPTDLAAAGATCKSTRIREQRRYLHR